MSRRLLAYLISFVAFLTTAKLNAHNAPGSTLMLDLYRDTVGVELRLPLTELELAFREPLEADAANILARFRPQLADYVCQHISARSPDARAWKISVGEMHVALTEQPIDLVVHLTLEPPEGAPLRKFTLIYDVISHEVMNHYTLVSVRSDWDAGKLNKDPEVVGTLRSFAKTLDVDRSDGSWRRGFGAVFTLGIRHIAEGTDHLLFLLALVLPAGQTVARRRWTGKIAARNALAQLARIVTAFTVGHSITLALGALGWVRLPSQPVEILIAVSILVSAAHAMRPIFPGREFWIASLFGLVHGMAFSATLTELDLSPGRTALTIFAFNLGIEVMQLAVVLATIPWLLVLAGTRVQNGFRTVAASFCMVAAIGWVLERATPLGNPVGTLAEYPRIHYVAAWCTLAAVALASWTIDKFCPRNDIQTTPN